MTLGTHASNVFAFEQRHLFQNLKNLYKTITKLQLTNYQDYQCRPRKKYVCPFNHETSHTTTLFIPFTTSYSHRKTRVALK